MEVSTNYTGRGEYGTREAERTDNLPQNNETGDYYTCPTDSHCPLHCRNRPEIQKPVTFEPNYPAPQPPVDYQPRQTTPVSQHSYSDLPPNSHPGVQSSEKPVDYDGTATPSNQPVRGQSSSKSNHTLSLEKQYDPHQKAQQLQTYIETYNQSNDKNDPVQLTACNEDQPFTTSDGQQRSVIISPSNANHNENSAPNIQTVQSNGPQSEVHLISEPNKGVKEQASVSSLQAPENLRVNISNDSIESHTNNQKSQVMKMTHLNFKEKQLAISAIRKAATNMSCVKMFQDKDRSNTGVIGRRDFQIVMDRIGILSEMSSREIDAVFKGFSTTIDTEIDYKRFVAACRHAIDGDHRLARKSHR